MVPILASGVDIGKDEGAISILFHLAGGGHVERVRSSRDPISIACTDEVEVPEVSENPRDRLHLEWR